MQGGVGIGEADIGTELPVDGVECGWRWERPGRGPLSLEGTVQERCATLHESARVEVSPHGVQEPVRGQPEFIKERASASALDALNREREADAKLLPVVQKPAQVCHKPASAW